MQIDFHFYTIYALARAAGFGPENAHVIAYASQHTDDAKYDHALEFENGGRFQQVLTAHQYDIGAISKPTCYRIWIPFHFLPSSAGVDFYEGMTTRPDSSVAQAMIEDLMDSEPKGYILHRLGILLHVYADTWSHQNFIGLTNDLNDVDDLTVRGEGQEALDWMFAELKRTVIEYAAPKLGHAQAGTIPDEPYREWTYKGYQGRSYSINNQERSLEAAQACYRVMLKFLRNFPEFSETAFIPWQNIARSFSDQFTVAGDLDLRVQRWKEAISAGGFGFSPTDRDINLDYEDREWFGQAVEVTRSQGDPDKYNRIAGFETSNWKYFHDAAAYHRFSLLHEILPEYGIICG